MPLRWATISTSNIAPDGSVLLSGYFMPLGAYAIARRQNWSDAQIGYLMWALLATGAFLGLVGVAQFLFDITAFNATYLENVFGEDALQRAIGTFSGPWEYGAVTAQLGIVGLYRFIRSQSVAARLGA